MGHPVEAAGLGRGSRVRVWYRALRPFSYPASITPVLVGTALAWHVGQVDWGLFALALVASMAIQAGTNLANEYFDYVQGLDRPDSLGPAGVILQGLLPPRQVLAAGAAAFLLGIGLGLYIVARVGWPILAVGFFSVLAGWFYTARPLALGYRGLGEPEVFLFMGPVMVMATYYVHTQDITWTGFLVSIPVGLLVTAILQTNDIRDVVQDLERGRLTWAGLPHRWLGERWGKLVARGLYYGMVGGAYLTVIGLVASRMAPVATLLTLATLPKAWSLVRLMASGVEGRPLGAAVRGSARLHMLFGAALALGYGIDILV